MGKKQYNSAADRKWLKRFQRIQERKEANWEYDQAKRECRKRAKGYYISQGFKPDRLLSGKVAVICHSENQVRQVINEVKREKPDYCNLGNINEQAIWDYHKPEVALGLVYEEYYFFPGIVNLRAQTQTYFAESGYEIVDFYDCIPVRDLGEICQESICLDVLFEV